MALAYDGAIQRLIDAFGRLPGIGPKGAQRIGCVGDTGTIDLEAACQKGRVRGGREDRHGITVLGRRHRFVEFKGRRARRHKEHGVQVEGLTCLLGGHQVTVMDGVKGTTHNAEPKLLPVL